MLTLKSKELDTGDPELCHAIPKDRWEDFRGAATVITSRQER